MEGAGQDKRNHLQQDRIQECREITWSLTKANRRIHTANDPLKLKVDGFYKKILFFLLTAYVFFVIILLDNLRNGEMSEWFMELVLKTSDTERYRRFESYSLRHFLRRHTQVGRRGSPAKGVDRE